MDLEIRRVYRYRTGTNLRQLKTEVLKAKTTLRGKARMIGVLR
jgi:hypothetical protein